MNLRRCQIKLKAVAPSMITGAATAAHMVQQPRKTKKRKIQANSMTNDAPFNRVMAIYAHPDDPEFFSGGSLIKWGLEGKELTYVLATSGDKGTDDPQMTGPRLIEIREAEQRAAAKVAGANEVVFLRYADGEL